MVFCAIVVDDVVINTWACDCENQQPKVRDAITEAREISDDGAAVIAF